MNPQTGHIGGLFDNMTDATTDDIDADNTFAHYEDDAERICNDLDRMQTAIAKNIFVNADDKAQVEAYIQQLYKRVALCRVDIRKLLYDE